MPKPFLVLVMPLLTCGGLPALPDPMCASPTVVYQDGDGDGHAAPGTVGHPYCEPTGATRLDAPQGYSLTRDDCDDVEARVFPGQSAWQSTPSAGGSWDFDCDGVVLSEHPDGNGSCRFVVATCMTAQNAWIGPVPNCGETGQLLLGCDATCQPVCETRVQRCR